MPTTRKGTTTRDRHRKTISAGHPPCAICGKPINYNLKWPHLDSFVVDHKIPIASGGPDTLANKQAAHNRCNLRKNDRLYIDHIIKTSQTLN